MGTWQKLGSVISRPNSSQRCQKSCLTDLKGVHHVAKNCLKNLATLKTRGKNFGDMFFDELNPNLKSVCHQKFRITRYQDCRVWLSATVEFI